MSTGQSLFSPTSAARAENGRLRVRVKAADLPPARAMSVARLAAIHRALLPQTRVVAPVVALVLAAGLLGGVIGSAGASSDHAKLASLQRMIALSRQDVRGVQAANTTLAGELADVRARELALQRAAVQAGTRERTTASGAPADQRHHHHAR